MGIQIYGRVIPILLTFNINLISCDACRQAGIYPRMSKYYWVSGPASKKAEGCCVWQWKGAEQTAEWSREWGPPAHKVKLGCGPNSLHQKDTENI